MRRVIERCEENGSDETEETDGSVEPLEIFFGFLSDQIAVQLYFEWAAMFLARTCSHTKTKRV